MSFSTMYIASTGMLALGTGMQTISNNLANVETVGFKAMRTNYEDLISQCYYSGNNHNQLGRGAKVSTIQSMFTQGSFRSTEGDTDMAIAGDGFFNVRNGRTGEIMYTRAGVYTVRKDGYMEDRSGNILQGWQMSTPKAGQTPQRMGNPVDIQISDLPAPPVATENIKLAVNLNADDESVYYYPPTAEGSESEGLGYAGAWNARNSPPISSDSSTHSEPMTVYDSAGVKHNLMVYYQKNPHEENVWDYIITSDPGEDGRAGADGSALFDTKSSFAGLIQKGKLTFSAKDEALGHGGLIKSIEAQNLDLANSLAASVDEPDIMDPNLSGISIGGYYRGSSASDGASSARTYSFSWAGDTPAEGLIWEDDAGNSGTIPIDESGYAGPYSFGEGLTLSFDPDSLPQTTQAGAKVMEVTAHSEQASWTEAALDANGHFTFDLTVPDTSGGLTPPYPSDTPTLSQTVSMDMGARSLGGDEWLVDDFTTTQYASKSSTTLKEADGYPESAIKRVYVRDDGMVIGVYDNKREQELYQVCVTRFLNPWGLDKKGDNLFAESRHSGQGVTSAPGENGAGSVLGNFLEQSNVDTATEIVNMIMTQRGFQANSKSITTSDTMLATAIQLKR